MSFLFSSGKKCTWIVPSNNNVIWFVCFVFIVSPIQLKNSKWLEEMKLFCIRKQWISNGWHVNVRNSGFVSSAPRSSHDNPAAGECNRRQSIEMLMSLHIKMPNKNPNFVESLSVYWIEETIKLIDFSLSFNDYSTRLIDKIFTRYMLSFSL